MLREMYFLGKRGLVELFKGISNLTCLTFTWVVQVNRKTKTCFPRVISAWRLRFLHLRGVWTQIYTKHKHIKCCNFQTITVMYIKVYISGMEMSQRIHFRYQILLKMMIFWENGKQNTFLVKVFCEKLTKNSVELKMPKFLENHVQTHV